MPPTKKSTSTKKSSTKTKASAKTKAAPKKAASTAKKSAPKKAAPKSTPKAVAPPPKPVFIPQQVSLRTDFGPFTLYFHDEQEYSTAIDIIKSAPTSTQGSRSPRLFEVVCGLARVTFRSIQSWSTKPQ